MKSKIYKKCKLSINVNKIATLRNSRGADTPNVVSVCRDLIRWGAEGITIHPRPDGRHIRSHDVYDISKLLTEINRKRGQKRIEFNIEGYPNEEFFTYLIDTKPDQATLVPDPPQVLTSNAGWALAKNEKLLSGVLAKIHGLGVRSSLFVDVFSFDEHDKKALERLKPDRIELYTEKYAHAFLTKDKARITKSYSDVAKFAVSIGVDVNAGHDLNSQNVGYLLRETPQILECSIGHAFITESLYHGLKKTLGLYLSAMKKARA
jgi:pyridoxine 5-phosphate synthase